MKSSHSSSLQQRACVSGSGDSSHARRATLPTLAGAVSFGRVAHSKRNSSSHRQGWHPSKRRGASGAGKQVWFRKGNPGPMHASPRHTAQRERIQPAPTPSATTAGKANTTPTSNDTRDYAALEENRGARRDKIKLARVIYRPPVTRSAHSLESERRSRSAGIRGMPRTP